MIKTITSGKEKAIQEKVEQLRKTREGSMKTHEYLEIGGIEK